VRLWIRGLLLGPAPDTLEAVEDEVEPVLELVVLAFLWIGAVVAIVIAWFAILITGRYPRPLFDYVVGGAAGRFASTPTRGSWSRTGIRPSA
jgi:hypothetical protein